MERKVKDCSVCHIVKPMSEFRYKYGSCCKECETERNFLNLAYRSDMDADEFNRRLNLIDV